MIANMKYGASASGKRIVISL